MATQEIRELKYGGGITICLPIMERGIAIWGPIAIAIPRGWELWIKWEEGLNTVFVFEKIDSAGVKFRISLAGDL